MSDLVPTLILILSWFVGFVGAALSAFVGFVGGVVAGWLLGGK